MFPTRSSTVITFLLGLMLISPRSFSVEPIKDIKVGDKVLITCNDSLLVLGKAVVKTVNDDSITVTSKGDVYTFNLTNITINGKVYAKSDLLNASTKPDTAFIKLLDLMEHPAITPPPDLRYSKPIPNVSYYPISGGRQIMPYRNVESRDPTFNDVMRFVSSSHVSEQLYVPDHYVCGNFAHDLIKSAENAGIKCTLASLQFQGERIGHAVAAFHTTDYGLIFIDCTGGRSPSKPGTYTTIGYIKPGKTYGRLPLDVGKIDPNHYEFYELAKAAIRGIGSLPANQPTKNSPKDIIADEFREQLRNDPYMDYEKIVSSVTLW